MINLYGIPLEKLEELMLQEGQSKFRAKQLYTWIFEKKETDFEKMSDISKNKPGFIYTNWCGNVECENKIKDDLGLKSRCIPFEENEPTGNKKCVCCNNDATTKIYWAKQY